MARSVLIFEWMVGGGLYCDPASLVDGQATDGDLGLSSLMSEGAGMLQAVADDFANCGVEPIVPVDCRFDSICLLAGRTVPVKGREELVELLPMLADQADAVILVAPESSGRLLWLHSQIAPFETKLLSPGCGFVELTTDKTATLQQLERSGLKVPFGFRLDQWLEEAAISAFPRPAMLKPNDGAGGEGARYLVDREACEQASAAPENWRIEEFVAGEAASISVLCSPEGSRNCYLVPTLQVFSEGHWVDCTMVSDVARIERATQLAQKVLEALPKTTGYIGIDFVFGDNAAADIVIEVNPRLTSSYLRLREHVDFNVAERMLELCDRRIQPA